MLIFAFQAENLVAVSTIIASTVLNAAYFLPILYMVWFEREDHGTQEHGEAPLAAVLALCITALLTLGFFLFNGSVIELESQVVRGLT